jgi:hypothetical protein
MISCSFFPSRLQLPPHTQREREREREKSGTHKALLGSFSGFRAHRNRRSTSLTLAFSTGFFCPSSIMLWTWSSTRSSSVCSSSSSPVPSCGGGAAAPASAPFAPAVRFLGTLPSFPFLRLEPLLDEGRVGEAETGEGDLGGGVDQFGRGEARRAAVGLGFRQGGREG